MKDLFPLAYQYYTVILISDIGMARKINHITEGKIQLKKQHSLLTAKKKKEPKKKRHPLTKMANYCNLEEAYGTKIFYNTNTQLK